MRPLREISDWGLADEVARDYPVLVVGFMGRLDPRHASFLIALAAMEDSYGAAVPFRAVNLAENPSLVQKLKVKALPAVFVYSAGREHVRWQGRVDMEEVASAVDALIRAGEGIE